MTFFGSRASRVIAVCGAAVLAMTISGMAQQPDAEAPQGRGGRGGGRGGVAPALFTVADTNKDGAVTRDELKGTFDRWYTAADSANSGSVTQDQLASVDTGYVLGVAGGEPVVIPNLHSFWSTREYVWWSVETGDQTSELWRAAREAPGASELVGSFAHDGWDAGTESHAVRSRNLNGDPDVVVAPLTELTAEQLLAQGGGGTITNMLGTDASDVYYTTGGVFWRRNPADVEEEALFYAATGGCDDRIGFTLREGWNELRRNR